MSQAVAEAVLNPGHAGQESIGEANLAPRHETTPPSNTGSIFQIQVDNAQANEEFAYRPLTPLAPITLFFAICSLSAFLDWYGVAIGGIGLLLGAFTLLKIWRSNWELTGWRLACFGTALSTFCLIGGWTWLEYQYRTELPEGFTRVNFNWLSGQAPVVKEGKTEVHPEVAKLEGEDIFIKGYMYPTRQTRDLTEFVLCKDTGECCFGGNPKPTDMIVVKVKDFTVNHREKQLVGVAGKFHASGSSAADLTSIYTLEATHFK